MPNFHRRLQKSKQIIVIFKCLQTSANVLFYMSGKPAAKLCSDVRNKATKPSQKNWSNSRYLALFDRLQANRWILNFPHISKRVSVGLLKSIGCM